MKESSALRIGTPGRFDDTDQLIGPDSRSLFGAAQLPSVIAESLDVRDSVVLVRLP